MPDQIATESPTIALGAWLFRRRTWLPLPIGIALLTITWTETRRPWILAGLGPALVVGGEALRMWAVRYIGTISRTRSDRLGPLVTEGPFLLLRNPLYLGNLLVWAGFACSAGLSWMVPFVFLVLGAEYHAITRWEEALLLTRLGDRYRAYADAVPRWRPRLAHLGAAFHSRPLYSWSEMLFSERGTLLALLAGYGLLLAKHRLMG